MPERPPPAKEEIESYLKDRRNWGRWGDDDDVGAMNLITPDKLLHAASVIKSGRSLSLSMFIPKEPGPGNPNPAQHWMKARRIGGLGGGASMDFYGIAFHGMATTHLDAICHLWDENGLYNGKNPDEVISYDGAKFGAVTAWSDGIVTRAILIDVPKFRGEPYVALDKPLHAWEIEDICKAQGVAPEPGDALAFYCGREAWQEDNPGAGYGSNPKPGLHASCIEFIRDNDICLIAWDMQEAGPTGYEGWDFPLSYSPVHSIIYAFGASIVDNVALRPLAEALRAEGRSEFMLVVAPLKMAGGTGSPVNPIALF